MYESASIAIKIKGIARVKNIIIKDMLAECGLSKNTMSSMLSGGSTPKSENLAKIADYLDCSVDYLLGRTDIPEINCGTASVPLPVQMAADTGDEHDGAPQTSLKKQKEAFEHYKD